ncbi:NAD(P)-dependent alcohol dehydrogenase [Flagellimonas flava]|uniref:NADPH:quinone reductase n=1 Tax=Flagellimonas flava TaxID=570519 RepID=A0A1M5IUH4_9FLAO|nr:NAD(P)-dependent alcohol dehydrogenase [Allomuricauda flava]SHG31815.1 NADPH:quinone reductase [Allomuricauda flava]
MKALYYDSYGSPEKVLRVKDIVKPSPGSDQLLIKIRASAINDYDWSVVRGKPYLYRLMFGLSKPKKPIPGMELAGTVVEVGTKISNFKVGDAVHGDISNFGFGSFAQYICISAEAVKKMPEGLDFFQAAALPHATLLAQQAFDKAELKKGQRVLINGGGGGVGTLGLQLAKLKKCYVAGVDSEAKQEKMLSLGFDKVIDYQKENFTKRSEQYDVILDCKTNQRVFDYKKVLTPQGKYISIGGKLTKLLSLLFWGGLFTKLGNKRYQILSLKPNEGLEQIGELAAKGQLKCELDGPHDFEDLPKLIQYFGEGKHLGKVVVRTE